MAERRYDRHVGRTVGGRAGPRRSASPPSAPAARRSPTRARPARRRAGRRRRGAASLPRQLSGRELPCAEQLADAGARHEAPNRERQERVLGDAEAIARGGSVAGREVLQVDARAEDVDVPRGDAVALDEHAAERGGQHDVRAARGAARRPRARGGSCERPRRARRCSPRPRDPESGRPTGVPRKRLNRSGPAA